MKVGTYSRTCQWLFPDLLGFAMAELVGLDSKSLEDIGMLDVCSACRYTGNAWEWALSKSCPQPMILGNHWTNDSFLPSPKWGHSETHASHLSQKSPLGLPLGISDLILYFWSIFFPVSPFQAPSHCFFGSSRWTKFKILVQRISAHEKWESSPHKTGSRRMS